MRGRSLRRIRKARARYLMRAVFGWIERIALQALPDDRRNDAMDVVLVRNAWRSRTERSSIARFLWSCGWSGEDKIGARGEIIADSRSPLPSLAWRLLRRSHHSCGMVRAVRLLRSAISALGKGDARGTRRQIDKATTGKQCCRSRRCCRSPETKSATLASAPNSMRASPSSPS